MSLAEYSDANVVARCRAGDDEAWRELVSRFSRYVYAICLQGFRLSPEDAEDVFQEVFARTYENLDRLRNDAAIRPWIAQLARRVSVDQLRARSREDVVDEPDISEIDELIDFLDEALWVHTGLGALSADCQEILDRFFARDESYRTIAEALSIPTGTVASRISRCLGRLRQELEGRKTEPSASSRM